MNFLIGIAAGFFGGITGAGGGIVAVPLMVALLKLDQHEAHGISLVALVFTGLAGAVTYAVNGSVDLFASVLMASAAVITARRGAQFAHALPGWKLKQAFGGYLLVVSLLMLLKPYLGTPQALTAGAARVVVLIATCAAAGFTSGMMGVGGGAIMIPAMVLLAGFDQHLAQGTSLLVMVPAGGTGAWTHWKLGNVRTALLPGMVAGVLLGSLAGSNISKAGILPFSLIYLGDPTLMSGDHAGAEKNYREALCLAKEAQSVPLMLEALAGLALFGVSSGKNEQAWELSTSILNQPSSTQETKDRASQIISEAEQRLNDKQIQALKGRVASQSLEEIVGTFVRAKQSA